MNSILSPREAAELFHAGEVRLLDVREPDEYQAERIGDAGEFPLSRIDEWLDAEGFAGQSLVVYCQSGGRSAQACARLRAAGCNVREVAGGLNAWKKAGLPTVRDTRLSRISIMRQVQITIGLINILGFMLAWLCSAWFLVLPIFTSCGLLFAGLSGTCGMAVMLGRTPWNNTKCRKGEGCK